MSSRSFHSAVSSLWAPRVLFSFRFLVVLLGKSEADWMTLAPGLCLTVQFQGVRGSLCSSGLGSPVLTGTGISGRGGSLQILHSF